MMAGHTMGRHSNWRTEDTSIAGPIMDDYRTQDRMTQNTPWEDTAIGGQTMGGQGK